jgi:hypothetical protein
MKNIKFNTSPLALSGEKKWIEYILKLDNQILSPNTLKL